MGKPKRHQVRVIAGRYRGRRLTYPQGSDVRPTMDKTREALFSAIQGSLPGCSFVDLFSAAGSVGIEALSRGASLVRFVERLPVAVDHLTSNLQACGVDRTRYRIDNTDVFSYLQNGGLNVADDLIVFADPPYDGDDSEKLLAHFRGTEYENVLLFILEHRSAVEPADLGLLEFDRTRRYGETSLTFWSRRS